jgi:hypothetical protein
MHLKRLGYGTLLVNVTRGEVALLTPKSMWIVPSLRMAKPGQPQCRSGSVGFPAMGTPKPYDQSRLS